MSPKVRTFAPCWAHSVGQFVQANKAPFGGSTKSVTKMRAPVMSYSQSVPGKRNHRKSGIDLSNGGSEAALIREIRQRAASQIRAGTAIRTQTALRLGIGDDCALLRPPPGEELAITTDFSIAGRHFGLDRHPPESIGHRVLARGLSDLAAMGARPLAAFLSLGLPRELARPASRGSLSWMSRFLDGLLALAAIHRTPLAGGDLAESPWPSRTSSWSALCRAGKRFCVPARGRATCFMSLELSVGPQWRWTGSEKWRESPQKEPNQGSAAHLYPQPRIAQGLWLQRRGLAKAAIDLSDGLSTDLAHICDESQVAAEVEAAALPIHPTASLDQALHGGEDYELLFTARLSARLPRSIAGVPVTKIGRIVKRTAGRPAVTLLSPQGPRALEPHGWEHFS